jgi:gliding motility-associated-like protein
LDSYCNQSNGTATAQTTGGLAPYTYVWSSVPQQTTSILQNVSGGTYIVTVTDSVQCTDTQTVTISDVPGPAVSLTSFSSICQNHGSISLSGGSPSGGTYSGTGVVNNVFNPVTAGPGTSSITYAYTDIHGCSGSAMQTIQVLSLPIVNFPPVTSVCANAPSFTLSGATPVGGTYSGTGVVGGVINPQAIGAGTYVITYAYTDGNACTGFSTQNFTVKSLPVVALVPFDGLCIDALPLVLSGGFPIGGTYSGAGVTNAIFYPLVTGIGVFPISYVYNDPNGCKDTTSQDLSVDPLPVPFQLSGGGIVCDGTGGLEVGMDSSQVGVDYILYVNGTAAGFPVAGNGDTFTFGNHGTEGVYTVIAVNPVTGCMNNMADTVEISLLPRPNVEIGDVMYLCDLPQIQLDAGLYQDSVTYEWQDGSVNRYLAIFEPGFYWVNVVLGNCYGEDTIEIKDCSDLTLPNVFTPNGDGKNDFFKPKIEGEIRAYTIQVFNRWGKEVYQSADYEEGWNGRNFNSGADCSVGVYFFVANYTTIVFPQPDRQRKLTGSVTLVK